VATNGYWANKNEDLFENWCSDMYEWRNCNDMFYSCDAIASFQKTFVSKKKRSIHDTIHVLFDNSITFPYIHFRLASEYIVSLSRQEPGIVYPAAAFFTITWKHEKEPHLHLKPLLQ
jgi:hypothetical protein